MYPRPIRYALRSLSILTLLLLLLALAALFLNTGPVAPSAMAYFPLLPLALTAVALDAIQRGWALWPRFGLSAIGVLAFTWALLHLVKILYHPSQSPPPDDLRYMRWSHPNAAPAPLHSASTQLTIIRGELAFSALPS